MSKKPSARRVPEQLVIDVEIETPDDAQPVQPTPSEQPGDLVAFAVVRTSDGYTPTRLTLRNGTVVEARALHDATVYEAVAYTYLEGDVMLHYEAMSVERSKA